jgi:hypothetical protein
VIHPSIALTAAACFLLSSASIDTYHNFDVL